MLLDSHELNHVVACLLDSFQIVISKISVRIDLAPLLSHTNMGLINSNTLFRLGDWSLMRPFEFLFWIPPVAIKKESIIILHSHTSPGRVSIASLAVWAFNIDFVFSVVRDSALAIFIWNGNIEASEIIFLHSVLLSVPVVEFSEDRNGLSSRCPFFVNNITVGLQV